MKVLFSSDFHHDLTVGGYDVREDLLAVQNQIVDASIGVSLVVLGGDMFHTPKPSPRAYADFIRFLNAIDCPVVIIPGNHDVGANGDALAPIREIHFPQEEDGNAQFDWSALDSNDSWCSRVFCAREPGVLEFRGRRMLLAGHISDHLAAELTEGTRAAQMLIDDAFRQARLANVDVAFCHLDVEGAVPGSEADFLRGGGLVAPAALVQELDCPVINGHIHQKQIVHCGGVAVFMPGSPIHTRFSKGKVRKNRYIVVDLP